MPLGKMTTGSVSPVLVVLTVVDLAGSERVSKSCSGGLRLEEAKKINKSIAALGNCIAARAQQCGRNQGDGCRSKASKSKHVPFRDSPLTRLLTSTLGGNTFTALIANVGPASVHFDETFSTLLLARRALRVKNSVRVNRKREKKVEDKTERLEREKRERRERREAEKKREQEEVRALMAKEEKRKAIRVQQRREAEAKAAAEASRRRAEEQQQQEQEEERRLREEWDAEQCQALLRKAVQTPLRPKKAGARSISLFYGAEEKKESVSRESVPSVVARPVNRGGLLWQGPTSEPAARGDIQVQIPLKGLLDRTPAVAVAVSARIQRLRIFACCSRAADRSRACPSAGVLFGHPDAAGQAPVAEQQNQRTRGAAKAPLPGPGADAQVRSLIPPLGLVHPAVNEQATRESSNEKFA